MAGHQTGSSHGDKTPREPDAGSKGTHSGGHSGSQPKQGTQHSSDQSEHRGGSGNFAEDRERASEAGKKGGKH